MIMQLFAPPSDEFGLTGTWRFSFIIKQMQLKIYKRVLLLATGALHNPSILNQKESIPSICHAIAMEIIE